MLHPGVGTLSSNSGSTIRHDNALKGRVSASGIECRICQPAGAREISTAFSSLRTRLTPPQGMSSLLPSSILPSSILPSSTPSLSSEKRTLTVGRSSGGQAPGCTAPDLSNGQTTSHAVAASSMLTHQPAEVPKTIYFPPFSTSPLKGDIANDINCSNIRVVIYTTRSIILSIHLFFDLLRRQALCESKEVPSGPH